MTEGAKRRLRAVTITGRLAVLEEARQHYDADRRMEGEVLWELCRAEFGQSFGGCPGYSEAAQAREQAEARERGRRTEGYER